MLPFDEARNWLREQRQTTYHEARSVLLDCRSFFQVHLAYQKIYPEDYAKRIEGFLPRSFVGKEIYLQEKSVEAVGAIFPVVEDASLGDDALAAIYIEPQSPSMSWDELDELLEGELTLSDPEALAFPMLIWSIGNSIDRETWERLDEIFGWGVVWPKRLIQTKRYIDAEVLHKKLKRAGLEDFMTSIKIAWRSTDNPFLDFDENYPDYEHYEFSVEDICSLAADWVASFPLVQSDSRAMDMLRADPSLLQKVVDIMGKSLEKPAKPKTLVEVFAKEFDHELS